MSIGQGSVAERLLSVPLFSGLDAGDLQILAEVMDLVSVEPTEAVVRQGEPGDELFVVLAGHAAVYERGRAPDAEPVAQLGPGDFFGEISLITAQPRTASVIATTHMALVRLSRDNYARYMSQRTALRDRVNEAAVRRAGATLHRQAREAERADHGTEFDYLLHRLVDHEIDSMRAAEVRGDRVTFDEVVDFYRSTGFLYPAKLGTLQSRFGAVRRTWEHLTGPDVDVFKILMLRRVVDGRLVVKNSICAFEYAPDTWQVQHLVSADRHEFSGTLAAVIGMLEWLDVVAGARAIRLTYRPDNPGIGRLFRSIAESASTTSSLHGVYDYVVTGAHAAPCATAPVDGDATVVRALEPADIPSLAKLYSSRHGALNSWLHTDDPWLSKLDAKYARHQLHRRRTVLVASDGARLNGSVVCWSASEGINFSFLENAAEDLFVDETLPPPARSTVARRLVQAALEHYRAMGRTYAVGLFDTRDRDLLRDSGLAGSLEKQYAVLTFDRSEFAAVRRVIESHYSRLLRREASGRPGGSR